MVTAMMKILILELRDSVEIQKHEYLQNATLFFAQTTGYQMLYY